MFPDAGRILLFRQGKSTSLAPSDVRLVGHWSIVPMYPESWKRLENGTFSDGDLRIEDIPHIYLADDYDVYISSVGIKKEYRHSTSFTILLDSILGALQAYAQNGIFFRELRAHAINYEGEALCRGAGFRKMSDHISIGSIYALHTSPLPDRRYLYRWPHLKRLYDEHFG